MVMVAGTVKTSMNHPTQGKTQMFRRNASGAEFQRICEQPRSHTGKGYQYHFQQNNRRFNPYGR